MAGNAALAMPEERPAPAESLAWPSGTASYWALFVIVLATFMTFFDQVVFGMLAERIKHDFGLTDSQLGFLAGPATIVCYLFVGIPLARLADIFPRKYVLAGGATAIGAVIALGGLAQSFAQFVLSRVFLAAGGSAHAPASYSLLADAFPSRVLTRAFALLQFGFIGGTTLGPLIGGKLVMVTGGWGKSRIGPLEIFGWQWILVGMGVATAAVALLFLTVKEPARHLLPSEHMAVPESTPPLRRVMTFMGFDAFRAIHAKPRVYYPLFAALALSAVDVFGLQFWRVPFLIRTYGWNEAQIGAMLGGVALAASLAGLAIGAVFVEWLARRYKDANVRAACLFFAVVTVCNIIAPMMPTGEAALAVMGVGMAFGMAGAVPQNAAIQRVAPNVMRGQVTAIYLFMFTFFGAMGAFFVGLIQDFVIADEHKLWLTLIIAASALLPLATFFMFLAIRPYREEVERLEALESTRA